MTFKVVCDLPGDPALRIAIGMSKSVLCAMSGVPDVTDMMEGPVK